MTSVIRLPAEIAAAVTARWPAISPAWCSAVEPELRELCQLYDAHPVRVLPARYSYLVATVTDHGPLVFRGSPDPDGVAQGHVAMALASVGAAPRLHELRETETGTWTVMDQAVPGTPLTEFEPTGAVLDALAELFSKLRDQPPPLPAEHSLTGWLRSRLLAGDDLIDLPRKARPAPLDERNSAFSILDDLEKGTRPQLCHGDASSWNILASGAGGLLLIDPRGVNGEPEYDLAVVALKAAPVVEPTRLASRLSEELGSDDERILAWLTVANAARV